MPPTAFPAPTEPPLTPPRAGPSGRAGLAVRWRLGLLLVLLLGGALVHLPAVRCPFILDDYMHASMIEGSIGVRRGPFDLYDFVNDVDRATFLERGLLPWWSHPRLTIRFFRPLSSALRWA